jgi:hypothetical protein
MTKSFFVTKADGKTEIFSRHKLEKSIRAAGADKLARGRIIRSVSSKIRPGLSTSQIHRLTFQSLKEEGAMYAAKYNLKKAIMQLGPDGFPFEEYLAALLNHHGYRSLTNLFVHGKCITHEVDIIAEKYKENIHAIVEVKFHSRPGMKTGSKDALYTYARFLDIQSYWQIKKKLGSRPAQGVLQSWLVTNTKLTSEAIRYCKCSGIKAIGWAYPDKNNCLQALIENKGLYPVTALVSLGGREKRELLKRDVVLCAQLLENKKVLRPLGLRENAIKKIIFEAEMLCNN